MTAPPMAVVGIGADGWSGLGDAARLAIREADLLVGNERQLALVPETGAERRRWPSPLTDLLDELVAMDDRVVCVLASGDPMLHGIGVTLARRVGPRRLVVHPHPSAHALACARLGWSVAETELVSTVARPLELLIPALQPGRRVVVYASGEGGAAAVARTVRDHGFGPSRLVVLEELGGARERIVESTAHDWGDAPAAPLHAVALECRPGPGTPLLPRSPGLPDEAFVHDGQLTKREVRAVTLASLAPVPGQLLWDVGAGSGSIAIEWLRSHPACRAIAVEARGDRAARIRENATRLGVPQIEVVESSAPDALDGLPAPNAVFVGGGVSAPGVLERCLAALEVGGRLAATAVTLESEQVLARAFERHGGRLMRLGVAHAAPVGRFTGWRPQMPVTQWAITLETG